MSSPGPTIEDLPPEMVDEIFRMLGLSNPNDLVACTMVNRGWKALYVGFSVNKLVALHNFERRSDWIPNKPVQEADTISLDMFARLSHQDQIPLISRIKSLLLGGQTFELPPRGPRLTDSRL